ncbi:MAG: serine hydrolase [Ferruginibacter sp.]
MFNKKIPLHFAILMTIAGIAATSLAFSFRKSNSAELEVADHSIQSCLPDVKRLGGYQYIRPLLYADRPCQSEKLMPLKNQVESLIKGYKLSGTINSASVYLRELNQGEWITAGDADTFNPGSLLKVPELMTFCKMNEKTPGLLDRTITYDKPLNLAKHAIHLSKSIELGRTYTIRELLYYMIAYSDNNATMLLNMRMDVEVFKKVFTDLGLPLPDLTKNDIPITAKDYSYFMRVLYNASYLNISDSEFCTELLSHSDFTQGLVSGLPKDVKVAHKFGEAGDGSSAHFSESGIIYIRNSPYLITVMTKGKDNKVLPSVISDISKTVFEAINSI